MIWSSELASSKFWRLQLLLFILNSEFKRGRLKQRGCIGGVRKSFVIALERQILDGDEFAVEPPTVKSPVSDASWVSVATFYVHTTLSKRKRWEDWLIDWLIEHNTTLKQGLTTNWQKITNDDWLIDRQRAHEQLCMALKRRISCISR